MWQISSFSSDLFKDRKRSDGFHFPQGNCRADFLNDAPAGSQDDAFPTGRMKAEHFLKLVKRFVSHVKPSNEGPVFLLLEDQDSHLSFAAFGYCKEDGVTALFFPPHCSRKLQPLGRTVCGPLSTCVNLACDTWIANHPGETMTIHDVPGTINRCLNFAATSTNFKAVFLVTVIFPYNRLSFLMWSFCPST